jgi:serine/threonine protein kinase
MLYWGAHSFERWGFAINLQNGPKNTQTGRLEKRTLLNKRYVILRTIGQGGMGAVYEAQDMRRKTLCAIKEMSLSMVAPTEREQAVRNFKTEAKMLAGLTHPNLPTFWGFFTEGPRHFLVMEYIDGYTLEEYLERNAAPFSERRVLGWARQLCDVLMYLHGQHPPIIFRDMKPGNIMLTRTGRVKLIDFGIARIFHNSGSHDTQLLGTPGFAPPEQYGQAQTDERSDIYSLAITLFQLLTNTLSEKGFGLSDVNERYPNISLPVARALERAAALGTEERFQNVEAFRMALLGEGTFLFEDGEQATTPEELVELCARFPEEASDYLFTGEIESWLLEIDELDLARSAKRLRGLTSDPAEVVERFLQAVLGTNAHIRGNSGRQVMRGGHISTSAGIPAALTNGYTRHAGSSSQATAELVVRPLTLDFGAIYPGISAPLILSIGGYKGAFVQGKLTTSEEWIVIDRTHFAGMSARINVQVDTARMRGSTHYAGKILVIPDEDDEEQDVVVRIVVDVLGRADEERADEQQVEQDLDDQAGASGMVMAAQAAVASTSARYNEFRAKYGRPGDAWDPLQTTPVQRAWLQRVLTVFAAFMLASLCYTLLAALPFLRHTSPLPPNPWFVVILLGMVPCAALGAVIGARGEHAQDGVATLNSLCTGASAALLGLALGEFAWQGLAHLPSSPLQLLVMLLLAALCATFGAQTQVSTLVIERLCLALRYIRWLVTGTAAVVGALAGLALTTGFSPGWAAFLAALLGIALALALVLWAGRQVKQKNTP